MNQFHFISLNSGIVIRPAKEFSATVRRPRGKHLHAVLALATLLALGMSPGAWAGAGGAGGAPYDGSFGAGGAGGSTSVSGPTAGATGGDGGTAGGAAGTAGSPNGGSSSIGEVVGGGGGGAGATGLQTTGYVTNASGTAFSGGNGGTGGDGSTGGAGGGGAGGYGVVVTAATGTSTNAGAFNGGAGGGGGVGYESGGGGGGQGGNGITLVPAAGGVTFINTGNITGGSGGSGGSGYFSHGSGGNGANGGSGIEIDGNGVTVINSGIVSGGGGGSAGGAFNGAGSGGVNGANGDAIDFNGNNNTLVIESGSNIIDNVVATGTGNTLSLGGANSGIFDTSGIGATAQYQGFNGITKTGSSNWTLTDGNTDDSTPWTVEAGTITVGATNAFGLGTVTQTGGTITTTGNGGTTIAIGSNFVQQAGATLTLQVASASIYDSLAVTGTATLNGTLNLAFTGSYTPVHGQQFTVVTTTGGILSVSSNYLNPVTNLAALKLKATGSVTDGGDDLVETVSATQQDFSGLFGGHYLTPNQLAVANNVDRSINRNGSGNFGALVTALDRASYSPSALSSAFNQLMPLNFARFASSTAFNNTSFLTQQVDDYLANHRGADGSFLSSNGGLDYSGLSYADGSMDPALQQIHSRLLAWNPAPSTGLLDDSASPVLGGVDMKDTKSAICCSSCEAPRLNFFVAGNVVLAQDFSDANTGLGHEDSTTGAVQLGLDYAVTPHLLVGALFGFGHTDADLDDIGSTASVDTYSPGVYASYSNNGWYANALGSYGFSDYNQHRNIQFGGLTGTAQSNPDGDQIVGNLDGGYDFHQGKLTYGPTAGVQYVHLDVDGYNEYGLPAADLNVNDDQADSLRSRVGGHVSYAMKSGGVLYTPHFAASWQHEFLDQSRGITSQFDTLGAGSFEVQTQSPSRDSALIDTGLDAEINKTITVFGDYTVQAGQSNYFGQSVQAGVKIGF